MSKQERARKVQLGFMDGGFIAGEESSMRDFENSQFGSLSRSLTSVQNDISIRFTSFFVSVLFPFSTRSSSLSPLIKTTNIFS